MNTSIPLRPTPLALIVLTGHAQQVWEKALRRLGRLSFAEIRDELHISLPEVQAAVTTLTGYGLVTTRLEGETTVVVPLRM